VRVVATAIVQQSISAIYHLQVYFPLNVIKLSVSCGWMGTRTSSNNGMNEGRKEGRKLNANSAIFSYIMARTSKFSMM
jgi:hypothetical protein